MTENVPFDQPMDMIWKFIRGEITPFDFHQWCMTETGLLEVLGEAHFEKVIATDYVDLHELKGALEKHIRREPESRCDCITLRDLADIDMADARQIAFPTLEEKARKGDQFWWLSLYQCCEREQWWLVAAEERINDVYLLKRLTDDEGRQAADNQAWPEDFDRLETVIKLGRERGHCCTLSDEHDPMLTYTVAELARERKNIKVSELAQLFNINLGRATRLAKIAQRQEDVLIDINN